MYGIIALIGLLSIAYTQNNTTIEKLNFFQRMQAQYDQINQSDNVEKAYEKWKKKYDRKVAKREEKLYRKLVFEQNYQHVKNGNSKAARRLRRFRMKANKFAQMTEEEFKNTYLAPKAIFNYRVAIITPETSTISKVKSLRSEKNIDYSVNWVDKGAVTSVIDQGSCGSCWAMAATGALEAHHFLKTGQLVKLSDQQLVDCSGAYGNFGCEGGWMANAFHYVVMHGVTLDSSYPYVPEFQTGQPCKQLQGQFRIRSYVNIGWNGHCNSLEVALQDRPVAVAVEAYQWVFYDEGVMDECGSELDHGVLLVGLNKVGNDPYWLVRNGWGQDWGMSGYIKIAYGNTCGICYYPSYPLQ